MFSISFDVHTSITIEQPVEKVFAAIADFNTWPIWSPWIVQESDCPVSTLGEPGTVGHKQQWNGKRIGSGEIQITETVDQQYLDYQLLFFSPWKSQSSTQFKVSKTSTDSGEEATLVEWSMQGSLPFFLFFMKKMMTTFITSDYKRGLKMLKEYLEKGEVLSKVNINQEEQVQGFYYLGFQAQCHIEQTGEVVKPLFEKLHSMDLPPADSVMTIINQFDITTGQADLTAALGYKTKPEFDVPSDMVAAPYPDHKAQTVTHIGSYKNLANGWATAMNYLRFAKQKQERRCKEYEIYVNDPRTTPEAELETKIFIPIK